MSYNSSAIIYDNSTMSNNSSTISYEYSTMSGNSSIINYLYSTMLLNSSTISYGSSTVNSNNSNDSYTTSTYSNISTINNYTYLAGHKDNSETKKFVASCLSISKTSYLTGFQLIVKCYDANLDNYGVVMINMICFDPMQSVYATLKTIDEKYYSSMSGIFMSTNSTCTPGYHVCGFKTRSTGFSKNISLIGFTDLSLFCCLH